MLKKSKHFQCQVQHLTLLTSVLPIHIHLFVSKGECLSLCIDPVISLKRFTLRACLQGTSEGWERVDGNFIQQNLNRLVGWPPSPITSTS